MASERWSSCTNSSHSFVLSEMVVPTVPVLLWSRLLEHTDRHGTRNRPAKFFCVVIWVLPRNIHEHFFCNRRSAATTEPSAGSSPLIASSYCTSTRIESSNSARWSCDAAQQFCDESARIILAGCSERPSSKAAASAERGVRFGTLSL